MSDKTTDTRLALLEQSQIGMSNDISEIKEIVKSFDEKLDKALAKKADVTMVDGVQKEVDSVKSTIRWVAYLIVGSVVLAILSMVYKNTSGL